MLTLDQLIEYQVIDVVHRIQLVIVSDSPLYQRRVCNQSGAPFPEPELALSGPSCVSHQIESCRLPGDLHQVDGKSSLC